MLFQFVFIESRALVALHCEVLSFVPLIGRKIYSHSFACLIGCLCIPHQFYAGLPRQAIDSKIHAGHYVIQSESKPKLIVSLSPTFSRALRRLNVFVLSQSMLNDCYTHGTTVYVSITYGLFSFFACRCQTLSSLRNADFLYGRDRRFSSETKSTYRKTSKQQLSRIFLKRKSNANEDFTMHNGAMAEMSNASRSGQGNSSSGSSQNAREEKLLVCQIESGL